MLDTYLIHMSMLTKHKKLAGGDLGCGAVLLCIQFDMSYKTGPAPTCTSLWNIYRHVAADN